MCSGKHKKIMKKSIFVLIVLLAIFSLIPVLSARAAALTGVTVSPSNVYGGYAADYTIAFTTVTTILAASTTDIVLTFPNGFNVSGAATNTDVIANARTILTKTVGGQEITLGLSATTTDLTASAVSLTLTAIASPTTGGSFTVAVETRDSGYTATTTIDGPTNAAFAIYGGRVGGTPLYSDTLPPTSKITSPIDGLTISVGEKYVIQGTAQDQGGSTVQKVEVSLDGGQNWSMTEIKSALANVFSWEYVWQNPTKGEYVIKVRATDALGNIESALTGAKVTVSVPVPPTLLLPEKPITEMTAQELEAKIVEVQQKIVDILTQLIQLFQQQIQALLASR